MFGRMADAREPPQSLLFDLLLSLRHTFKYWIAAAFGIYRRRSLAHECSVLVKSVSGSRFSVTIPSTEIFLSLLLPTITVAAYCQ